MRWQVRSVRLSLPPFLFFKNILKTPCDPAGHNLLNQAAVKKKKELHRMQVTCLVKHLVRRFKTAGICIGYRS